MQAESLISGVDLDSQTLSAIDFQIKKQHPKQEFVQISLSASHLVT